MIDDTFRLAPTPAHATDAEISGLFRLLEQPNSSNDGGTACRTVPIVADRPNGEMAVTHHSSPADRSLRGAFVRYTRAAAALIAREQGRADEYDAAVAEIGLAAIAETQLAQLELAELYDIATTELNAEFES